MPDISISHIPKITLTGYVVLGCVEDGAWTVWGNSSAVVAAVVVAQPGTNLVAYKYLYIYIYIYINYYIISRIFFSGKFLVKLINLMEFELI